MKILTILLILLQINTFGYGNYSSPYSNRYNSYSSVSVEQTNRKIGYTTNYGNTFGYTTQQTYSGTYNPASSSGGRPGQPRRVVIKHGNDSIDTGLTDDHNQNWKYGYGTFNFLFWHEKRYYYTDEHGHTHYWDGNKWFDIGWGDVFYHHETAEAYPSVPMGDPDFYLITALLFSYFIYIYMKKRRQQFLLYTGIKR